MPLLSWFLLSNNIGKIMVLKWSVNYCIGIECGKYKDCLHFARIYRTGKNPNKLLFYSSTPFSLKFEIHHNSTAWKVSKYGVISGPDSVRIQENTNQKQLRIWTLFTQWALWKMKILQHRNLDISSKSFPRCTVLLISMIKIDWLYKKNYWTANINWKQYFLVDLV